MKTLVFFILTIFASSCANYDCSKMVDNDKLTKREIAVKPFNALSIGVVFETILVPSDSEKVVIEATEQIHKQLVIENSANMLTITMDSDLKHGKEACGKMTIYFKRINSLTNKSVGTLTSNGGIKTSTLLVNNDAVGSTNLTFEADSIVFNNNAVGITELSGTCKYLKINNNSVGKFDAMKLKCDDLELKNASIGETIVFANKLMNIENSGIGSLDAYGKGVIKNVSNKSIGSFTKHNE